MIITFHGEGCFKIQSSKTVILTESFTGGGAPSRLKADIFIKTNPEASKVDGDYSQLVKGPGEYEIKGVEISGYPAYIYHIKTEEDIDLGYFGANEIKNPAFNADVTRKLMDADIMFLPDCGKLGKLIRQFHPKIVIITSGNAKELEKELGMKAEVIDKLVAKKRDLLEQQNLKLILLKK